MILIHWNTVTINRKIAHGLTLIFGKRLYIHQNLIKKTHKIHTYMLQEKCQKYK